MRSLKEELRKLDFEPKINREPNLVGLQILVLDKNKAGTNDLNINFWNVPHPLIKSNVILIEARASKAKIRNDLTMSEHCQNVSKMGVISTFQNDEGGITLRTFQQDKTMDLDELREKIEVVSLAYRLLL